MKYFLIILSDWRFSAGDLTRRLRARWPGAIFQETNPESISCFEFELPMAHSTLHGVMHRDGECIPFSADIRDIAEFSLWVRSFVPEAERLHFCDEGGSGQLDLRPDTSSSDIFRLFDYVLPPPGWKNYSLIARPRWTLAAHEFARLLLLRWPSAQVQLKTESHEPKPAAFQVPMKHSTLTGSLYRPVPSLDFTGDPRDCAEFSLWCRSILVAEQVSVSGDNHFITLHPSTTVEDFLRTLGAPPS
jgi:hypothetical protein